MSETWDELKANVRRGWTQMPAGVRPVGRILLRLTIAVLIVMAAWSSYYQVEPEEVGVVQRFGKLVRTTNPGPHLKLPLGMETVTKVPIQRQLKMEFGFRTEQPGTRSIYAPPSQDTKSESLMLTGDLNVAVVEWIVQFRIKDPRAYLFNVRDVAMTLRYMSEAAMRQVVGDHSVDEVITIGREAIAFQAKEELNRLCDLYEIGIEIQQLVLQDVNPPDPVKPAFNEVNQAIQEKERSINDAWADFNMAVPKASGVAEQAIRAAEGYALERENNALGDASRFSALYEEYRKAPAVTRKRIYMETMNRILPKLGRKVVLDEKARGILPLLQLDAGFKEGKP